MNMNSRLRTKVLKPANRLIKGSVLFLLNPGNPILSANMPIYWKIWQNVGFSVTIVFLKGQKNPLYQTGLFPVNYLRRSKPRLNTVLIATR